MGLLFELPWILSYVAALLFHLYFLLLLFLSLVLHCACRSFSVQLVVQLGLGLRGGDGSLRRENRGWWFGDIDQKEERQP